MGRPSESNLIQTIRCYDWTGKEVPLPPGRDPYETNVSPGSYILLEQSGRYIYMCGSSTYDHRGEN
jgi:hypothetical protein